MAQQQKSHSIPPFIVALVGWLIPGVGYWLIGKRGKAMTIGITILILFTMGLLIGGMKVVAPLPTHGPNALANVRNFVMQNPWFVAQVLTGPTTLVCGHYGNAPMFAASHSHSNEIGTLYTSIAGMLNLLAIIDSSYRAAKGDDE